MKSPIFRIGQPVRERGGQIRGVAVGLGKHLGEWIVRAASGVEVSCLAETLEPDADHEALNPPAPETRRR